MSKSISRIESIDQGTFLRSSWRPWREITLIMLMIMEVSWVVPWYRSLTAATYSVEISIAFMIFLTLVLVAHYIIRFVNYLRLKIVIRQIVIVLCLLVSILVGLSTLLHANEPGIITLINQPIQSFTDRAILIPDEFIVIIAVIIGWWRGISLAQAHVGPHLVMAHFNIGIFMFFLFGLINTMVTGESPGSLLYVFIFACLLAMSSARISIIHLLRGGGTGVFDRRWFAGILFASLVVVILTILSTSFLGKETGIVGSLITGLIYIITLLSYLIFSPLIFLFIWLFENFPIKLEFFEGIVGSLNNIRSMMEQALNQLGDVFNQTGIPEFISKWGPSVKAMIFWGIIFLAICIVAIWVGFRFWNAQKRRALEEDQQSILDAKEFWKLLRSSLQDRLKSLWENLPGLSLLSGSRRLHAAERIRQIYIEMMDMCQTLNYPRPEAATPIEFMPVLKRIFPENLEDIEVITLAYTRIRYGQLPEQQSEVYAVENAWDKIHQKGKSLMLSEKNTKKPPVKFTGGQ